jgi:hypothetical protein
VKFPLCALTGDQTSAALRAAHLLPPCDRAGFLRRLPVSLCGQVVDDDSVLRAIRTALREYPEGRRLMQ